MDVHATAAASAPDEYHMGPGTLRWVDPSVSHNMTPAQPLLLPLDHTSYPPKKTTGSPALLSMASSAPGCLLA